MRIEFSRVRTGPNILLYAQRAHVHSALEVIAKSIGIVSQLHVLYTSISYIIQVPSLIHMWSTKDTSSSSILRSDYFFGYVVTTMSRIIRIFSLLLRLIVAVQLTNEQ